MSRRYIILEEEYQWLYGRIREKIKISGIYIKDIKILANISSYAMETIWEAKERSVNLGILASICDILYMMDDFYRFLNKYCEKIGCSKLSNRSKVLVTKILIYQCRYKIKVQDIVAMYDIAVKPTHLREYVHYRREIPVSVVRAIIKGYQEAYHDKETV